MVHLFCIYMSSGMRYHSQHRVFVLARGLKAAERREEKAYKGRCSIIDSPMHQYTSSAIKAFPNEVVTSFEPLNDVLALYVINLNYVVPVSLVEIVLQWRTQGSDYVRNIGFLESVPAPQGECPT